MMQRSQHESISLDLVIQRITKRTAEIGSFIYGKSESLLPIQFKETSGLILTPPMIPAGGWQVLEDSRIPMLDEDSKITWFRRRFSIPESLKNCRTALYFSFANITPNGEFEGAEGMVYINGTAFQGIDKNHPEVFLPADFDTEMEHELTIRVNYDKSHQERRIVKLELRELNLHAFGLHHKLQSVADGLNILDKDDFATRKLIEYTDSLLKTIPFTQPGSEEFMKAVEEADKKFEIPEELAERVRPTIRMTGNCHIDAVWMRDLEATGRKTRQVFATMCRLLEEYPDFTYFQSQPLLYEFIREPEPELFSRIRKYAQEGRWEPEGAAWLEPDANMPSGESLIRQFIYGKRYFQKYFGYDSRILWLPDTFGFNGNLPQIAKKCGVDYFSTTKMSWNTYTKFPRDAFRWQGIDGSEILAQFQTAPNKDCPQWSALHGKITPFEIKETWNYFSEKHATDEMLHTYGYDDSLGGPVREMMERMPVMDKLPGMPAVKTGRVMQVFEKLEQNRAKLPVWKGELYLEYHRGSLTSRSDIKRLNRRNEHLINCLEKLYSLRMTCNAVTFDEETRFRLDEYWKVLLLNQFHDILAGTCVHDANEQAVDQLEKLESDLTGEIKTLLSGMFTADSDKTGIFNPHVFPIHNIVEIRDEITPSRCITDVLSALTEEMPASCAASGISEIAVSENGKRYPVQNTYFGKIFAPALNPLESEMFTFEEPGEIESFEAVAANVNVVESPFYTAVLSAKGEIVSLLDKRTTPARELIKPGETANRLSFFEDRPLNWDAWDIDEFYREFPLEEPETIMTRWVEKGPVRCSLVVVKNFRNSAIMQHINFYAHTPAIEFETLVDWHDKNVLIKTSFPVNVNADEDYSEIPFGFIKRSTLSNQPDERAMFETPVLRWSSLYENGYGAALINDSKYACSNHNSTLELTLLKSAVHPDPDAEEGFHHFTYTLLPCLSSAPDSTLITEAAARNLNAAVFPPKQEKPENAPPNTLRTIPSFSVKSRENHIILETIKPGEDNKSVVLRLYESLNGRGEAEISIPAVFTEAVETDMREETPLSDPIEIIRENNKSKITLTFKPFEVKTVKLTA
ncbi:MAG: glycosyl hydrolase-related protein [Firmicutes bacterium]|nr:glycosyl hydrolase-related protein [Bacillota bacterium]